MYRPDYIGMTGKISQESRMIELAREYRRWGKTVIFGGCHVSLSPERLRNECDILVQGELESIAGKFFADLNRKLAARIYRRKAGPAGFTSSALGSLPEPPCAFRDSPDLARLPVRVRIL